LAETSGALEKGVLPEPVKKQGMSCSGGAQLGRKTNHKDRQEASKKAGALTLAEFESLATDLIDRIPEKFCTQLNGGFMLLPEVKKDGDFYIMGEYVEDDIMGCSIILYYGSFTGLLKDADRSEWLGELQETIWHEIRHHLESLAGVEDLVLEEMAELEALLKQIYPKSNPQNSKSSRP